MKHIITRLRQLKVIQQIMAGIIIIWICVSAFYILSGVLLYGEYYFYEFNAQILAIEWVGSALLIGFGVWFFIDAVRRER